jgi:sulfotransferase family protein
LHMLRFAKRSISFREYMDAALAATSTKLGELYPFLEFGFYCRQIERYLAYFPRQALGVYFYEDYRQNPLAVLQEMFRFLGVDPEFEPDMSKRHMLPRVARSQATARLVEWARGRRIAQKVASPALRSSIRRIVFRPRRHFALEPADRSRLVHLYRDDIRGLSALLDRDLDAWLIS